MPSDRGDLPGAALPPCGSTKGLILAVIVFSDDGTILCTQKMVVAKHMEVSLYERES